MSLKKELENMREALAKLPEVEKIHDETLVVSIRTRMGLRSSTWKLKGHGKQPLGSISHANSISPDCSLKSSWKILSGAADQHGTGSNLLRKRVQDNSGPRRRRTHHQFHSFEGKCEVDHCGSCVAHP